MDFVFDQLDSTDCPACHGLVDVAGQPAFKLVVCPNCNAQVRVPGKLGSLLLQEVVGTGSAGIVYKAIDAALARPVAVKILKNEEGDDKKIVEATVAEARALAAINHPNVVHVHTIGMRHGQPYIVMELLIGSGKLNVMLKEGWVADEKRGLEIGIDVAQGLRAAHGAGLLHRDVKPGNILFNNEGVAKLLDFSVVHAKNGEGEKLVIGTPYYISPEAARGQDVDFRTDIYSLGATLFHLMTGRPVFDGDSSREVLRARLKQAAPDVREFKPHITARTAEVLARMLAIDPNDRQGSYDDLIAELRDALEALRSGQAAREDEAVENSDLADLHSALAEPVIPVATPRRARAAAPPAPKKGMPIGLIGALAAAGIGVVVGIVFLVSGGSDDVPKNNVKDGTIAANTDGGRTDGSVKPATGDRDKTVPPVLPDPAKDGGKDGEPPDTKDAKDSKDTKDKSTSTPVTPQPPDPPIVPQPPKEDPFTTALKAWEQETASQLKRDPTVYTPITFATLRSAGGATLTPQADGSILVSGANPATDTYTLEAKLPVKPEQITGIRIEALNDATLGGGGPGRSAAGNFVLSQLTAAITSASNAGVARAFTFHQPAAEFAQEKFPIEGVLDADAQTGWAISPRMGRPTAAVVTVRDLAAGPAPRNRTPIAYENFETAPGKFSDKWTAAGNAFRDRPFKDGEIVLPGLAGFQGQHMAGSVLGTGLGASAADLKQRGTGTLSSKPFKIERDSIAFLLAAGNSDATRIQLKVDGKVVHKTIGDRSLKLKRVLWDVRPFEGKEGVIEIIDEEEKDNRGYILVDQIEFTDEPAGGTGSAAAEQMLRLTLAFTSAHPQHALGKFRVSITTNIAPFLDPKLPENIKAIVETPQNRTPAQAKELEAYFRRTKIEGLPYLPPGTTASTVPAPVAPVPTPTPAPKGNDAPKVAPKAPPPRAAIADNRKSGWAALDGKLFTDEDGLLLESTGNDPRLDTTDIKTDFNDRSYAVKVIVRLRTTSAGSVRLDWKNRPKGALNPLADNEVVNIPASQRVRDVLFKVKVTGKLEQLTVHVPKGETVIESIRVLLDKDNKPLDVWDFGK